MVGYYGRSQGLWIREKLVEAGDRGVVPADLHHERLVYGRAMGFYKGGTYHSFVKYFYWLQRLGWVEPTGEEEPSTIRGGDKPINPEVPRKYFRITRMGRDIDIIEWSDPLRAAGWYPRGRPPTGRPRGRPPARETL